MKKLISLIFLIMGVTDVNAQFIPHGFAYAINPAISITFLDGCRVLVENNDKIGSPEEITIKKFDLKTFFGVPFMTISCKGKTNRVVVLYNKELFFVYKGDYVDPYLIGFNCYPSEATAEYDESVFSASNELIEGNRVYTVKNLASWKLGSVWAVPNHGINETITIDYGGGPTTKTMKESGQAEMVEQVLYLFSGYISYEKPELYRYNSRPKKIKVTLTDQETQKKTNYFFDLKDTPNPQKLQFDEFFGNKIITITILEAYEGIKYSDLCINHIFMGISLKEEYWYDIWNCSILRRRGRRK